MKKFSSFLGTLMLVLSLVCSTVYAGDGGEMGVSGGISEGTNLPFTMDKYVDSGLAEDSTYAYKEYVFISGKPILFTGTITVTTGDVNYKDNPTGTYNESYQISATSGTDTLEKTISYITSYRLKEEEFNKQIIRNSQVSTWTESISIGGTTYALDEEASTFSKASVEHITPGVSYYDTVIAYNANYTAGESSETTISANGNVYGYNQPWSKVETQNITMDIMNDEWQMTVSLKPFLEASKSIYYDQTKPYPISFGGTYNQRLERESTLSYEILSSNKSIEDSEKTGQTRIVTANVIEKLPIPENLDFLYGHWAEDDLKKLYSMEILTERPKENMQFEAMTRGEFIKALCIAMGMDLSEYEEIDDDSPVVFDDVPTDHSLYKYIMAAYDAKLIKGVGERFNVALPITRQEAFVVYIRVIGLERLGITNNPVTPFVDDGDIASWARKEIMAGYKLGIIQGTNTGKVNPTKWINKAEAAAIINRLIDYLRAEISEDYK